MAGRDILTSIRSDDPAAGLRAVGALRRLAEQVEATHVRLARERRAHRDGPQTRVETANTRRR
jgi:hypothetical protein